ncbi:MAG: PIG-L family deacetylase [Candidatus Acidiferrales bacterium]
MRQINYLKNKLCLFVLIALTLLLPAGNSLRAQSLPETVESIDKARVVTRILFITAHPDDEASGLLSYLSHGLDADVGLLTLTRGQGGQNAIGPEQGERLGILRTSELLAASNNNGVEQFFTRAMDTGYSKSADQTMKIWGDVPLEDMVRVLRMFRPNVVINGWGGVHTGHGQHQASGILTPRAVAAAADPNAFPDQIREGLAPWRVQLLLEDRRTVQESGFRVPVEQISALWGKSYNEFGRESLVFHRSQGVTMFVNSPFLRWPLYLVVGDPKAADQHVGPEDLSKTLLSLVQPGGADGQRLANVDESLNAAEEAALHLDWAVAAKYLAAAGTGIAGLEDSVKASSSEGKSNLLWELSRVRERIDRALGNVAALHIDARANRDELVAGETFKVDTRWTLRENVGITVNDTALVVPDGWSVGDSPVPEGEGKHFAASFNVAVPRHAVASASALDYILPYPPPLVVARTSATVGGYTFTTEKPVVSIRPTSTSVDTFPLTLVPAVTLTIEPKQVMQPESRAGEPIELLARVRYHATSAAKVALSLNAPAGWSVAPVAPIDFSEPGDQLIRFTVTPPAKPAPGAYALRAFGKIGDESFSESLEPLPSLPTRSWSEPPEATVHVLNLAVPPNLRVGYIAAENDVIPESLRQLGIDLHLLNEVDLAFGDLGRYDAIVVGIRAYELRHDLPRSNPRLLDYVNKGGTLVVQYQRDFAWNKYLPAPYPAKMPDSTARTTDANSPVNFLAPKSAILNFPNKITQDDFKGWIQERGLYYLGTFDTHYQPVLGLTDPGESEDNGALIEARFGKGTYIYTGLSFFRELPAGVPGAYRLFVNLISQSKANTNATAMN